MAQGWSNVKEVPKSSPVLPNPLQSSKILLFPLQSPLEPMRKHSFSLRSAARPFCLGLFPFRSQRWPAFHGRETRVARAWSARCTSVERELHARETLGISAVETKGSAMETKTRAVEPMSPFH